MKKFFMTCLSMLLLILLSSFTPQQAAQKATKITSAAGSDAKSFSKMSIGYFVLNGQEYHVYADEFFGGVIELWTVDVFLNDVDQLTDFDGTWYNSYDGRYNLTIGFYHNGSRQYTGMTHFH